MYPDHIRTLQSARIDAANALHEAEARCRALRVDGPADEYAEALAASKAARFALYDAEQALSAAIAAWRREGERMESVATRSGHQHLHVEGGRYSVTVTVDYTATPPAVTVDESGPGHWSCDDLTPDGWVGRGFGGNGDVEDRARETLRRLRAEALTQASKRWRVVRRRWADARAAAAASSAA